jgi:membrane protease YdiL (CAAX protease family)
MRRAWMNRRPPPEFLAPQAFSGRGEIGVALVLSLLWFGAIVIRLGYSSQPWTWSERFYEAGSFVVFATPVLWLATPWGERGRSLLVRQAGLGYQLLTCGLLSLYMAIGQSLAVNPGLFPWRRHLQNLILPSTFFPSTVSGAWGAPASWCNAVLFLLGAFVALRLPFVLLQVRRGQSPWEVLPLLGCNLAYLVASQTSLISTQFRSEYSGLWIGLAYGGLYGILRRCSSAPSRLELPDLALVASCLLSLVHFARPFFSFGVFIGLTLFVVVMIFATGMERSHFGYSFQPRGRDFVVFAQLLAIALVVMVPLVVGLKFGDFSQAAIARYTGGDRWLFGGSYAILFALRVGVFEEVVFRAGLMTVLRDCLWAKSPQTHAISDSQRGGRNWVWDKLGWGQLGWGRLALLVGINAVIFGLCHLGNEPKAGAELSVWAYKGIYLGLATLASGFYGWAFGVTNRLLISILIHGLVDTIAVVLLGSNLVVPF